VNVAKSIINNFFSMFFSQICSQFFSFFTAIYLARTLGAEGFGFIAFSQAIVSYFTLATDLGLPRLGTRELSRNKNRIVEYVSTIVTLRILLSLVALTLLVIFAIVIKQLEAIRYITIIFGLTILTSSCFFDWVFRGVEKMKYIAIANIFEKIVYLVLIFSFVKQANDYMLVPIFFFTGAVVSSFILIGIFRKQYGKISLTINTAKWKTCLKLALPMAFGSLMVRINNNFDSVLIGFIKGEYEVGLYAAAYKIILVAFIFGGIFNLVIFPIVCRYYYESLDKMKELLSQSNRIMITIGLPIGLGGIIISDPILLNLFGESYLQASPAFKILSIYVAISFITMIYADTLIACNCQKKYAIGVAIAAIVNLTCNFILIPIFGLKGAALSTVAGEIVLLIYSYFNLAKIVKIELIKFFPIPIISTLIMGIFLRIAIESNFIILIFGGIAVYITSVILLGGVSLGELKFLYNSCASRKY
jgi:O-antigen/teichoic acid export membrane protein